MNEIEMAFRLYLKILDRNRDIGFVWEDDAPMHMAIERVERFVKLYYEHHKKRGVK